VLGPLLFLWMTHPSVVIDGHGTCPSPAEVQRRLGDLMAGVPDAVAQDRAHVEPTGSGLHVDLRRDDGGRIAERVVTSSGTCADLASASAVIIATWEAQLRPERMARIRLPAEDGPAPATIVWAAPRPPAEITTFQMGAAGLVSLAPQSGRGNPALGGLAFGTWAPRPSGLGVYAAAAGTAARSSSLSSAVSTSWTRVYASVGPFYRFATPSARIELGAEATGGVLFASASGVTPAGSDHSPVLGFGLGARVAARWAPMAPWLGVEGLAWTTRDRLYVQGLPTENDVPRLEALIALGVSVGRN
jgi:hypothetical protein